jgi:hypothetical protein
MRRPVASASTATLLPRLRLRRAGRVSPVLGTGTARGRAAHVKSPRLTTTEQMRSGGEYTPRVDGSASVPEPVTGHSKTGS